MDQKTIFLTILGMAVVTYLPRVLPVWFLSSRTLPDWLVIWLRYIPVAVLAAMLFPALLVHDQQLDFSFDNYYLWAAIPCFLVVWKTRSYFGAVVIGMAAVASARYLFGG